MTPREILLGCELEDFVGCATDFEGADGLKAFGFEVDFFGRAVAGEAGEWGADERGLDGDGGDAGGGGADFGEGDKGFRHLAKT